MLDELRLIDVDASTFDTLPCCGIQNKDHPGRRAKCAWFFSNLKHGLRAKALVDPAGQAVGYGEAIPGERAWRAVDAAGYLFLHCVWLHARRYAGQGWGGRMIEAFAADAKASGMRGLATVARDGTWMAGPRLFLANGFETVDAAPPDYHLLARKLDRSSPDPAFRPGREKALARYGRGLTIVHAGQCPYAVKFAAEIAQEAEERYGIEPRIVPLKSCREAQNAPTPYATFALILDGRVVADHPVSRTRFRNIMRSAGRFVATTN